MNQKERFEKIAAFVQNRLNEMARKDPAPQHDPVYRWDHTPTRRRD